MFSFFRPQSGHLLVAATFALLLSAANCNTPDDDDDTPPVDGNVRCVGGAAFETIQEAIDNCPAGGSIIVNPGIYDEDIEINKEISLSGPAREQVLVTGGGAGTIVEIDQVDGLVQITGMSFQAPYEELSTVRGFRITSSANVVLHELNVGFAVSSEGTCDHGLVGIEASQSTVAVSDSDIVCVGFTSENGGVAVLAQTDSTLTVSGSRINGAGSFGIRAIDSSLSVDTSDISGINRPSGAESFESDGTGIYAEQATDMIQISETSISNGSFVGAWIEGPGVTITQSSFGSFSYGVYHPGDAASAAGRTTTITDSTFLDIANEAVLTFASSTITGNEVRTKERIPDPLNSPDVAGIRVVAPGGTVNVSNNVIDGVGQRGIGIYGNNNDGSIPEVTVANNKVTNIIGGNGIDVHYADLANITENTVTGADHAYFDDDGGSNAGAIVNGYGIDCFYSTLCAFENNTVSEAEFANIVVVNSGFSMTGDTLSGGVRSSVHLQSSQGTIEGVSITETQGYGLYAFDVTLQMDGVTVSGVSRGPNIQDLDGVDDPPAKELQNFLGGTGIYVVTQGAPTFLSFSNGTIENCADGGMTTSGIQLELVGNLFINNGFEDETGFSADSSLQVYGVDELANSGPLIQDNLFDGGNGFQGIYMNDVPGVQFLDNTVCVGGTSALYLRDASNGVLSGNSFGTSEESTTSCGTQDWNQSIYMSFSDEAAAEGGIQLDENTLSGPHDFGFYINGGGDFDFNGNTISDAEFSAIFASASLAVGLTSDGDGDGLAEYNGDCNDTDPTVGGAGALEITGDGLDNNCDGITDDGVNTDDGDADGFSIADGDCNDNDPLVFPGATEVVGNSYDDNCDGWAEFDGPLPQPTLTLVGNTIADSGIGINSYGAALNLPEPGPSSSGNIISNIDDQAIRVRSWTWSTTPALTPGSLTLGAGNTLGPTGAECVELEGVDVVAAIGGATLAECGTYGISQTGTGSASVTGTSITEADLAAIRVTGGTATISGGTVVSGPSDAGLRVEGGEVTVDGLMVSSAVDSGIVLLGGELLALEADLSGGSLPGVDMSGGVLEAHNLNVAGFTNGLEVRGGTVELNSGSYTDNDDSGIYLSNTATAVIYDPLVENNTGYGLLCDGGASDPASSSVTLTSCSVSAQGNGLGPYSLINGCELTTSCVVN